MEFEILKQFCQIEPYIDQVISSADQNKKSLGFLPRQAYQDHALQERLWIYVDESGNYCGHLIFGGKLPSLHILQIYIRNDKRQHGLASQLLCELERYGEKHNCLSISARVAADLKVNQFWERLGYKVSHQVDGGKTTGRKINIRIKDLDVPSLFDYFENPPETEHIDLTIKASSALASITYAIDVNVILDLIKDRSNAAIVQRMLGLSMYGSGQICVTSEFVSELEKHSRKFQQDPLLSLAKSLPTLPKVSPVVIEPIVSQLRSIIFPERQQQNCLSENDKSDLSHIAQCIHHEITGFITSDSAILKVSEEIYHSFGIQILSPSEAVELAVPNDSVSNIDLVFSFDGSNLKITKFEEGDRQLIDSFLREQGVTESERIQMLDSGVIDRPRMRWLVKYGNEICGFSSWGGDELANYRMFYLVIDEQLQFAQKLIDHFIEKIGSFLPKSKLTLIVLSTAPGSDLTRKAAIDRGYRKNAGITRRIDIQNLIKITYKGYITSSLWDEFRKSISMSVDLTLPERMPTYNEFVYTGAILKSKSVNGIVKLPLFEMETIFSPSVFLCSGREAVIVPIKKRYVERLLAESMHQLSLLPSNEALLHVEKVYFRSTRNTRLFKRGDLMLFYVSGKEGGQEVIGHGRITSSRIMSVASAILKLQRQGAFEEQCLHDTADSNGNLHAITFDNFLLFSNPVSYGFLKRTNIISRTNLVSAERITSKNLNSIIDEGGSGA